MIAYDKRLPSARHIGKRGDQRTSYRLLSPKNGAVLHLESNIEALVARALELDTRVRSFEAQPFTIELNTGQTFSSKYSGRKLLQGTLSSRDLRFYTPDFCADRRTIIECKPSHRLDVLACDIARWRLALTQLGYDFKVVTELYFREDALERNLLWLYQTHIRRLSLPGAKSIDIELREYALTRDRWTLGNLAESFGIPPGAAVAPIVSGDFRVDLRTGPISPNSVLTKQAQPELRILP